MPKNKGKGGKNRRRGKNENESEKRELIFKEDEQEYAQVTKMLGNGRLEAMCFDGLKRLCHIRGKLRKKVSKKSAKIVIEKVLNFRVKYVCQILQIVHVGIDREKCVKFHCYKVPDKNDLYLVEE